MWCAAARVGRFGVGAPGVVQSCVEAKLVGGWGHVDLGESIGGKRPFVAFLSQARLSLRMPWWSFVDGFAGMRDAARLTGGSADVRAALEEQDEMSNMPGMKTVIKTGECMRVLREVHEGLVAASMWTCHGMQTVAVCGACRAATGDGGGGLADERSGGG